MTAEIFNKHLEFIQKDHMAGRADRQPFRNALDHAEQHGLERFNKQIHTTKLHLSYKCGSVALKRVVPAATDGF